MNGAVEVEMKAQAEVTTGSRTREETAAQRMRRWRERASDWPVETTDGEALLWWVGATKQARKRRADNRRAGRQQTDKTEKKSGREQVECRLCCCAAAERDRADCETERDRRVSEVESDWSVCCDGDTRHEGTQQQPSPASIEHEHTNE